MWLLWFDMNTAKTVIFRARLSITRDRWGQALEKFLDRRAEDMETGDVNASSITYCCHLLDSKKEYYGETMTGFSSGFRLIFDNSGSGGKTRRISTDD